MNKDEIIAMAKEVGFPPHIIAAGANREFARFAAMEEEKEREACAQVCEGFKQGNSATYIDDDWADMCAAAIRARGKP